MTEFEEVYRQYCGPVFRFLLQRLGRRELAEDLTAEVFLALYRSWSEVEPARLPGWLYAVGKNLVTDYWRHCAVQQRHAEQLDREPFSEVDPPDPWLFENKALKPIHRVCLILRYVHGMEREEISRRTGLTDNQVKSCLQYARHILRQQLTDKR
jgi:RNA polymerase sigma-70 factor (ECF subfamily)